MQALLVVLGTVAAVAVGLATWLSVAKVRAERERDRALERGRVIARVVGTVRRATAELLWSGDSISVRGTVPVRDEDERG